MSSNRPPRPPPRWRRRPDARPAQILEAAFRVFGSRGLHKATLDEVAREAGITKGTIYLYFPSKAALFASMIRTRVGTLLPGAVAPDADRSQPDGRLAGLGAELYTFLSSPAYLGIFRAVVGEAGPRSEEAARFYREGVLPVNRQLAEIIRTGIAAGRFRAVDPMIAARAFAGMFLVFAVSQRLLGGERIYPIETGQIVETVTSLFLRGILAEGAKPSRARGRGRTTAIRRIRARRATEGE
jgi:AcrR family transcriptional regulator